MEDLGKSIPAGEALVDAEQGNKKEHPNEYCLNCGTKLLDAFCQHCGQKDIPQRQTIGELWTNFISSFWSYEGKFFKTTKYLITKPGYLAEEYTLGKRESYYHPARMYVFISFVFFLAFFSLPDNEESTSGKGGDNVELTEEDKKEIKKNSTEGLKTLAQVTGDSSFIALSDSIQNKINEELDSTKAKKKNTKKNSGVNFDFGDAESYKKNAKKNGGANFDFSDVDSYKNAAAYDSIQQTLPEDKRDNWFEQLLTKRAIAVHQKYGEDTDKYGKDFINTFKEQFSKVLFYLLPFFALLLKLLYLRRGYYYSEHLVFSIYYYNFFYLAGTLQLLVNQLSWLSWISGFIVVWIMLYLLFAMKRMYKQSWGKTILKYLIFGLLFMFLVAIAFFIAAVVVFLTI
jgi:hypothetical protein